MPGLRELLFSDEQSVLAVPVANTATSAAPGGGYGKRGEAVKSEDPGSPGAGEVPGSSQAITLSLRLPATAQAGRGSPGSHGARADQHHALKNKIHRRLIESLDIGALMQIDGSDALETAVEHAVRQIIAEERLPLSSAEKDGVVRDVVYETLGLGPLEPLFSDPDVNDILVNGPDSVFVDRDGKLQATDVRFKDASHLLHVINRIVSRIGRRVDEASPIVDARLPDGSRVNAVIPPLSLEGPVLSIRRFRQVPFALEDLVEKGTLSVQMAEFLALAVRARLNILISGGTAAGKTTLLNVLSRYIGDQERIITIEDTAELRLQQRHVVRLESRPANIEGEGTVTQRDLVKNALRMRPDRIVVGEVRGPEALDMLQAMNTGHEGSLTTVHANSPRDAVSRIETLVLLAGIELSQRSIREQIGSAFDLVVQLKRLPDGSRKVVSIAEITGVAEGLISMQELFAFRQDGIDAQGRVAGEHRACAIRPLVEAKFREASLELRADLFAVPNRLEHIHAG
ncbi:MAG TPA: CpaF family protein [Candidatus Obscuribacterales bacterium]